MDKKLFQERIRSLSSFLYVNADVTDAFGKALTETDDWGLCRINPLRFAKAHGLEPNEAVDLFVCASRIGLFDLRWNLICPACGGVLDTTPSINQLNREPFHCALCDIDVPIILDDYVEITFTISPDVHEVSVNPYESFDTFRRAFFSENLIPSERMRETMREYLVDFDFVMPGAYRCFEFQVKPDTLYRLISMGINSGVSLCVDNSEKISDNPPIHIHASSGAFSPQDGAASSGRATV